jgi:competence protein ComEC
MKILKEITHKSQILFIGIFCFLFGVVLANFFTVDFFILFCGVLVSFFILIVGRKNRFVMVSAVLLLLFIFGFFRYQVSIPDPNNSNNINYYNGEELTFEAKVVDVDTRINGQKLTVEPHISPGARYYFRPYLLVRTDLYPQFLRNDILKLNCKLKKPDIFEDFNYEKYLARYNVYSICNYPDIELLSRPGQGWIFGAKQKLSEGLNKSIKEPQASVLQAMVFGNRRGISSELLDQFSNSGISHIIAISGMHIMIITTALMYLLIGIGLNRRRAFWVAVVGLALYITMIGAPASAVRAGIMIFLVLLGQNLGRMTKSINAVILAAFLMLVINPKLLISDVGFQLSFMAVLGIIYLFPIFQKYFKKLPDTWKIRDMVAVTLSAQIMTLPLILYYFQKLSLLAVIANLLILPIVPILMGAGILISVVGAFSLGIGRLVGYAGWFGVGYVLKVSEYLSDIPFMTPEVQQPSIWIIVILYGIIGWWIVRSKSIF